MRGCDGCNPELMKACENGYGEGGTLGRIRSGTKLIKKDELIAVSFGKYLNDVLHM